MVIAVYRKNDDDTTGIIVIAVVCCAVGTSAVWVIIIYHSQKQFKHREQQLKTFSSRTNHQDTKSELSASSKDSGTGDSRRSNDNLPIDSSKFLILVFFFFKDTFILLLFQILIRKVNLFCLISFYFTIWLINLSYINFFMLIPFFLIS